MIDAHSTVRSTQSYVLDVALYARTGQVRVSVRLRCRVNAGQSVDIACWNMSRYVDILTKYNKTMGMIRSTRDRESAKDQGTIQLAQARELSFLALALTEEEDLKSSFRFDFCAFTLAQSTVNFRI